MAKLRFGSQLGYTSTGGLAEIGVLVVPSNTVAPVVSGTVNVGQTLTTTTGTWTGSPNPSFTYQWQRAGVDIAAATNTTYVLTTADINSAMTCNVTGSNAAGSATQASNSKTWTAFVSDTFTGTDGTFITAHTGETGATWTDWQGTPSTEIPIASNRVYRNATSAGTHSPATYASGTPPTADYLVEANIVPLTLLNDARVYGRIVTGAFTGYRVVFGVAAVTLQKVVAGSTTTLGSSFSFVPTANVSNKISLRMTGTLIEALLDGTVVASATDSAIAGAGQAGVGFGSVAQTSTTGFHISDVAATG